jgi:hypothetical protein
MHRFRLDRGTISTAAPRRGSGEPAARQLLVNAAFFAVSPRHPGAVSPEGECV